MGLITELPFLIRGQGWRLRISFYSRKSTLCRSLSTRFFLNHSSSPPILLIASAGLGSYPWFSLSLSILHHHSLHFDIWITKTACWITDLRGKTESGASLVAQWQRSRLPMQETQVQSLIQEDPTCHRATKPVHHNYWSCALGPWSCNYWAQEP